MFEQSAPKDWSRAFPPAEDESPSDSAEPAAGPAKSPLPPMPIGGPAPMGMGGNGDLAGPAAGSA
ncbi:hypothetical protein OSI08_24895, partial [Mycobacterium ulcerans]